MKTVKLVYSGGFHGADEIAVLARIDERGNLWLSARQIKRLERHFCGISDCCCGGVTRADVDGLPAGHPDPARC